MLAHCLQMAGKEEEGISLLLEGLQFAPPTGEHCCEIGEYFYEKGQWEQVIFWYESGACRKTHGAGGVCAGGMLWISALYSALCLLWQAGGMGDGEDV